MKKVTSLSASFIDGSYYTSASHLQDLFESKAVNRSVIAERHGVNWSEYTYRFTSHHGVVLADVTKYSDYGFSSQAYGVKVSTNTLKNPIKVDIDDLIYEATCKFLRKNKVIKKIAFIEKGREYYQ